VLAAVCILAMCGVTAECTHLMSCGGCTFWKDADSSDVPTLSRTGTCEFTCSRFDLRNKGTAVVASCTFAGLGSVALSVAFLRGASRS